MKKTIKDKLWDKFGLSIWCDWLQIDWKHYNWISFSLINVYFEYDKLFNEFQVELSLFGFGLRWQYELPKKYRTKEYKSLIKQAKEIYNDKKIWKDKM